MVNIENSFNNFILTMNAWELHYYREVREEGLIPLKEKMKRHIDAIFLFFTEKRKESRAARYHCSAVTHLNTRPPKYS
ncbi:NTF2 fold immunity protein [Janthinobacterium sp. P210006]|uniref:NTF2 fold immunity protein n=1 Tax=Janthinobacterium sp. P210006 TaxID=3112939 RepID=UPI003FA5B6BC